MEYEVVIASKNKKVLKSEGLCCSDDVRTKWRQLFPCSEHYESYPRPIYCPGLLKFNSGEPIYIPMIYTPAVDIIYQNASPYFSESFGDLLEIFSLMIGEDVKVVYAFFLMLEMKCLMPNTLNELNEIAKNCEKFTTCAQVELLGDEPRNVEVEMCRINEDVESADFKFLVTDMGDIEIDVEKTSRTPVKRRMKKSCDCTPKKRSKEQRKQSLTVEHPEEQTDDTDEEEIVITRTYNDKLANDFDQMNLYPEGKQTLQPGTNSISRSMSDDTNIISLSDDG
ncbi:unnamed protein product [Brugia pahangi]|uniref:DNA helicase n=1 Tax=Brugia pahangi TaxID=6280 RepID=A0A0N4T9B5_BRUPA|nr:unnamed protein product [Brugia pahangi]